MAAKTHSFTFKLYYSSDGTNYTKLTDMRMIMLPGYERGDSETTNLESEEAWREWMPSWKQVQDANFEAYFTHTQYETLFSQFNTLPNDALKYYRVECPLLTGQTTPLRVSGQGYLKSLTSNEATITSDDPIMIPFTIKWSGKPTISSAA